ncbi:MAG: hypothetical protein WCO21_03275 [bacterium]
MSKLCNSRTTLKGGNMRERKIVSFLEAVGYLVAKEEDRLEIWRGNKKIGELETGSSILVLHSADASEASRLAPLIAGILKETVRLD